MSSQRWCQGYVLSGDRDGFEPADVAGQVEQTPVQRFRKDLIAAGTYRHPAQGWTLAVTPPRLAAWCAAFARMRQQGVDVEVTVDHSPRAAAVQGYLVDMFVEGDRLIGIHEMIGQDAIDLACRVKNVSVEIDPDFVDGRGERYGEAIVRSSLVQAPVVPDQAAFVPLAASRGEAEPAAEQLVPLLRLALEPVTPWAEDDLAPRLREAESRVLALQRQVEQLQPVNVDARTLEDLADMLHDRLDGLLRDGRITPAARDRLAPLLLGETQRRPALMLSRAAAQRAGFEQPLARLLLDALAHNEPTTWGECTGGQAIALARPTPDGQEPADPHLRRRMTRAAYGQE